MAEAKSADEPQAVEVAKEILRTPKPERWRGKSPWDTKPSPRFSYFEDDERFVVVAQPDKEGGAQYALAYGLSYCGDRQLILALPKLHCEATMQRVPWLRKEARPEIWIHDGVSVERVKQRKQAETRERLAVPRKDATPEAELTAASRPTHLREQSKAVYDLVEWATKNPLLDPGHRRGERSWHCMGQKVLSMTTTRGGGVRITAGIHFSGTEKPEPTLVSRGGQLSEADVRAVRKKVEGAIAARLRGKNKRINRRDEHWLQAVIRQEPSLVGVEQPALRELPAWRPKDAPSAWSRGYIDLIGVDGHGDIRLVETKIATNDDALLVLQGLDYYVWCLVYEDTLRSRLGAPKRAQFEIHFVIGTDPITGEDHVSNFSEALAAALDPSIRWRGQRVQHWSHEPGSGETPTAETAPPGHLLP